MKVESITQKEVTTKFGAKPTFSFKADGEWYKCGFKKPPIKEGDVVDFTFKEGTYGKDVDMASIKVLSSGGAVSAGGVKAAPSGPRSSFPISPLDGQRSIIRQNCVGNARELFIATMANNKELQKMSADEMTSAIISIARKFEAYAGGELDMAMASVKTLTEKVEM
jgi:hypothetical protein